jgi:hypothetical protein
VRVDSILESNVGLVQACDKKAKDVASGLIDALKTRLEDGGPGTALYFVSRVAAGQSGRYLGTKIKI